MPPTSLRLLVLALPLVVLAGCGSTRTCGGNADYLAAVNRPPLRLPPEITPTERMQPLAIPPADPNPAALDPVPECLDEPPRFFARQGGVADPAEEVVRLWAAAWADRKADVVLQAYSPGFQASGEGGSVAFLEQRRQQVEGGRAPEAKVDDLTVATAGPDRRVVTFIQRFGEDAVRKELTLVREGSAWRIVAERTVEVL
jgi:hypothetical protein